MRKYYVTSKETCPHCENGMIYNPIWQDCNDELRDGATNAEVLEWFNGHDYYPNSRSLPPEEIQCSECDEATITNDRVPLEDALDELGYRRLGLAEQAKEPEQNAIEQICELLMQVDSDSQFHQLSDCLADIQGVCEEYLGE